GWAAMADRQTGQQTCRTRHVPVVFYGLVGTACNDIFVSLVGKRVALYQYRDDLGKQIIGANLGQAAGMASKSGSETIINKCVHVNLFTGFESPASGPRRKLDCLLK